MRPAAASRDSAPARSMAPPPAKQARLERTARETARAGIAASGLLGGKPAAARRPGPIRSDLVPTGGAEKLPPALRRDFEARLGIDLEGVRLHHGAAAAETAREAGAHALATGDDVLFAAGRYRPDTEEGRALLLHELAHVAQSRTGAADGEPLRDGPPKQGLGSSPPDSPFERGKGVEPEDDHVLFDHDKADLDPGDLATLRALASKQQEPAIVDVYGYSSAEGDPDYNHNLSAHRAVRVKETLDALLPAGSQVTARAHGEVGDFGRAADNRRAGVKVRQSTPQIDADVLLAPYRRRSGLLGDTLQLKLDPTLFMTPLGSGLGGLTLGEWTTGAVPPPTPVIPGIGGVPWTFPPQPDPLAPWIMQPGLLQRPQGTRLEDFDLSPITLSAGLRGLQLRGEDAFHLQNEFIRQTDGLMKLGVPPWLAGIIVRKTLEAAAEERFKFENPNFKDVSDKQDEMRGTSVHSISIDLLDVPDYIKKFRKFTGW